MQTVVRPAVTMTVPGTGPAYCGVTRTESRSDFSWWSLTVRADSVSAVRVSLLTLLIASVAGLGVLNTMVLQTRERVHDLGVFKAIGMTPRQTIAMVLSWVTGTGLVAGVLAVPIGIALQHHLVPVVGEAAGTAIPAVIIDVYRCPEIAVLALTGIVIAAAGALAPAAWAAGARTASALRAE